jgi:hypothetical protein
MANAGLTIGDTFLLRTPPNDHHLFVAIARTSSGKSLCVNVTSYHSNSDTSCVLNPGDHYFIKNKSVINYGDAREIEAITIANLINSGFCTLKGTVSTNVLRKIQQGGLNSKMSKNKFKQELKNFLGSLQP